MLQVSIRRVHPGHLDLLCDLLGQVGGPRRDEALATLEDEGVRHEMALLIETKDGPAHARRAVEQSRHRIDVEHKRVLRKTIGAAVDAKLMLDLRSNG